ncbi:MAG TPA: hypothetical protein VFA70_15690 [Dehalococcoidia bacterium]|nr:hypothetical protein [Dehalococcoidia bacterium]
MDRDPTPPARPPLCDHCGRGFVTRFSLDDDWQCLQCGWVAPPSDLLPRPLRERESSEVERIRAGYRPRKERRRRNAA